MKTSRRRFLVGSGLLVGLAATASLSDGLRDWLVQQIRNEFGDDIAASPETAMFMDEYLVFLKEAHIGDYRKIAAYFRIKPSRITLMPDSEKSVRNSLLNTFLRSTNTIRCLEGGEDFVFVGIFDPDKNPCVNQLSATAL